MAEKAREGRRVRREQEVAIAIESITVTRICIHQEK